jgi:hypothetical protein
MRFMEAIRRKGHWFLIGFLIVFTISLFFGLTGGFTNYDMFTGRNSSQQAAGGKVPSVVSDKGLEGVAMVVNGRKVSNDVLEQTTQLFIANYNMEDDSDPTVQLNAYGYAANMVVSQEVLMAYGEEHGVKMSAADWDKAKADSAEPFIEAAAEDKKSGNIVGDTFGKLGDIKAQKAAFRKYLEVNGYSSEESWERDAQRDLYSRKVREAIEAEVNAAKKAEAEKTKALVDKELGEGKDFAEVAKKYSDGQSKDNGGDLDWVGRDLLEKEVSDKLFAVEKGETSEWIEIPAGFQKFLVLDKKLGSGAEFEQAKDGLKQSIRDQRKDQKYEPTEDELKRVYEKVHARVIELHITDLEQSSKRVQEMLDAARVEVNHPYVLVYQALRDYRIQAGDALSREQLIKIAELAPVGAEYDWSVLDTKLAAGRPAGATTTAEDTAAEADEAAEAAAAADEAVAGKPDLSGVEAMTDSAGADVEAGKAAGGVNEEDKVYTPIYALAVGLIEKAIQDSDGGTGSDWPYFLQAKIYFDWMQDEAEASKQPLDTKAARPQIEELLARVVKSSNYNATAYAMRGVNLARLEQTKQAEEALTQAEKYASNDNADVWQTIRDGYEVLDNSTKLTEIDKKLQEIQQEQFQQMLQQQLSQQAGGGGGAPIQIR